MQRLRIILVCLGAAAASVVLLSSAARLSDLPTPHTSPSPVERRQVLAIQTLFAWDSTSHQFQDAQSHVTALGVHFRTRLVPAAGHIVTGMIIILLAGLQFLAPVRRRWPWWHRRVGRVVLVAALIAGASGLYLGVGTPYAGWPEAVPTALFGALFLLFVARAYRTARRRAFSEHREWVIRLVALAVGVGTIRLVGLGLVGLGMGFREEIGWSFAIGWTISLLIAEWWIRWTRGKVPIHVGHASAVGGAA